MTASVETLPDLLRRENGPCNVPYIAHIASHSVTLTGLEGRDVISFFGPIASYKDGEDTVSFDWGSAQRLHNRDGATPSWAEQRGISAITPNPDGSQGVLAIELMRTTDPDAIKDLVARYFRLLYAERERSTESIMRYTIPGTLRRPKGIRPVETTASLDI